MESRAPSGFVNLGSSCYINASIQALMACPVFQDMVHRLETTKRYGSSDSTLVRAWLTVTKDSGSNGIVRPCEFLHAIRELSKDNCPPFASGNQEDAHEFIVFLLEALHECFKRKVNMQITGEAVSARDKLAAKCYHVFSDHFASNYSEILDVFYGIQVTCLTEAESGKSISVKPEPMASIDLPIISTTGCSLESCIERFCCPELIQGVDAGDGTKVTAARRTVFWSLPRVLIVKLNRWTANYQKNSSHVSAPMDDLDLSSYTVGYRPQESVYSLQAVCDHIGGVNGGHYSACVRRGGHWFRCDDEVVQSVDAKHVVTRNAYCLFYQRK